MSEERKKKANLIIAISDTHFGHESCFYDTFWYCMDKLCEEIEMLKNRYDFNKVILATVGDIVSGTQVYRNQYLESHLHKNEDIITFAAYMYHMVADIIADATGFDVEIHVVTGTHEGLMRAFPHNFGLGVSRRLASYGYNCRYHSKSYTLNFAKGFKLPPFHVLFYHGYGHADYSSASPSLVREMTTVQSQFSTQRNKIIRRFVIGHSHWLEIGRSVLGIRFDCLGGFMRWDKKVSNRDSGFAYYTFTEEGEFDVKGILGLKQQIIEEQNQGLHGKNMLYVAQTLNNAYEYELDLGILKNGRINKNAKKVD